MTKLLLFKNIIFLLFSFCILIFSCENKKVLKKKKEDICVCLQPFENFDTLYITHIKKEIKNQYQFKSIVLPPKPLPKNAYTLNIKGLLKYNPQPYARYRADSLLYFLLKSKPVNCDYILGLTAQDISTTNKENKKIKEPAYLHCDWGIFGLGFLGGNSCVVSSFRLSFGTFDKNIISKRVAKTTTHEIGHNLGLDHCLTPLCNMNAAPTYNALGANDQRNQSVCKKCKEKLKITKTKND
ncbi:MAG: hypothetical protein EAY69_10360 [Cytophagales bacterium]|nr:MAG: hypothetical protein EAY69_10360 [Cytophagales bacterium]